MFAEAPQSALHAELTTSFGQYLSPEEPLTSISFEPDLSYKFDDSRFIGLYSFIDRPTNRYENFSVPKTIVSFTQKLDLFDALVTKVIVGANFLNLHRWNADGYAVRTSVGFQAEKEVTTGLVIEARLTPYGQINEYRQTTSGVDQARYGLTERLSLAYTIGDFDLEGSIVFEQRRTAVWNNDYSTLEQVTYNFSENMAAGINHSFLGSVIDNSTGLSQGFRFFDERESRVSAFLTVRM